MELFLPIHLWVEVLHQPCVRFFFDHTHNDFASVRAGSTGFKLPMNENTGPCFF